MKPRSRLLYTASTLCVIALGLASRKWPSFFPSMLGKYPGDVLWALMVFLLWGIFRRDRSTGKLAAYALITSYLDEFSQLYQAPWINAIRASTVGHLILGSTFSWGDMVAYTIGIAIGAAFEKAMGG